MAYFKNSGMLATEKSVSEQLSPVRRRIIIGAMLLVTALLIVLFKLLQSQPPRNVPAEKRWQVEVQALVAAGYQPQLNVFAGVESPFISTLDAEVEARVSKLLVLPGQQVSYGQALLELDPFDVQQEWQQKQADVDELRALIDAENNRYRNDRESLKIEKDLLKLAQRKLQREEATSQSKLTSLSSRDTQQQALDKQKLAMRNRQLAVDDHPTRLTQLQARLQRSQAQMRLLESRMQNTLVVAPFDGVIQKTLVSPGERVQRAQALLRIASSELIELKAGLPAKTVPAIKRALQQEHTITASIVTAADTKPLPALTLHRLFAEVGKHGSIDAFFRFEDSSYRPLQNGLTLGETLELRVNLPSVPHSFRIPVAALYGTDRVYVVEEQRLHARRVNVMGSLYEGNQQFLLVTGDQLKTGDTLLVTQLPVAIEGLKVESQLTDTETEKTASSPDTVSDSAGE